MEVWHDKEQEWRRINNKKEIMEIKIIKRDGRKQPIDIDKIHKVVSYACEGLSNVSPSEVEINSKIQFYDGITSCDIQETLIRSAADMITDEQPNYQYVAGRLVNYHLRKQVYDKFQPDALYDIIQRNVKTGFYDKEILDKYSKDEINTLDKIIKHERDEKLSYAAMEQFRGKYLVRYRSDNSHDKSEFYETPQIAYMLIAATLFGDYPAHSRMNYVRDYYHAISTHKISLPTPIMAGVRTPQRQFSSCVLVDCGDSLDSINATSSSVVKYVSQKAGIGINVGRIRAIGSPIRKGQAMHTGLLPFIKLFQASVKSCSQGGVRGGAATLYFPCWHYQFHEMIVLKNNKGIDDNRARHVDYGVQFNKTMYDRLINGGKITLFCPNDVPGLYEAFFNDTKKFEELYVAAENNPDIRKQSFDAITLFGDFIMERADTGRIYLQNVDNTNTHSSFDEKKHPIFMSNLCAEITLPTIPLNSIDDKEGAIPLCTLSALNWGNIKSINEFPKLADLTIRALDALLDYQDYPVRAAKRSTMLFRSLGVGIINLAYWLAKNDTSYQQPNLELVDEWMEAMSFALINASVDLAIERGPCKGSDDTKYGKGILPIDTYKKELDELIPHKERQDWNHLRQRLKEHGIRNATLMAIMPAETSAIVCNATNGVEPPRALVSVKGSKEGVLRQVVPGIHKLRNKYDLLWEQKSPEGYLKICAVLQKYIDQSISTNTSYNPLLHGENTVGMKEQLEHILKWYRWGGKTLYYSNRYDGAGELSLDDDCDACKI